MFAAYHGLLRRLSESNETWQDAALCLTPAAQLAQRAEINHTAAPISDRLLHELFAERAERRPEQIAVVTPQRSLTYAELRMRAGNLARRLRRLGAQPNQLVAVVMEKGREQVVATLAAQQAGAAYLPIAADTPAERLLQLLDHSQTNIVLTQSRCDL
jgi:non-ribosomal peptide synthetase component F